MHLLGSELRNKEEREAAEIELPKFDKEAVKAAIRERPQWVHSSAGSIFRAFPAAYQQRLLNDGVEKIGITVAEGYNYEIIKEAHRPQGDLSLLVTLKANGTIEKTVTGSLAQPLTVDRQDAKGWNCSKDIFASKTLQMVSSTTIEKDYSITSIDGPFCPDVKADLEVGPEQADSYIGKLSALCYWRYTHGAAPLVLVSVDNCSHNGDKLYVVVDACARAWTENEKADSGFLEYIENPAHVSFPWSMINKIIPRPDDSTKKMLEEAGFTDVESIVTSKNICVAPFVNVEEAEYLVTEDAFSNGHPRLGHAGITFTIRDTAEKVERMKVYTCLNPLHITLAAYGYFLGYTRISEEVKDADLVKLVRIIGYKEGPPVVTDPGVLSPKKFVDEVLQIRVPNPFMPDTLQRIACDTSQKLSIRFGETIKEYTARPEPDVKSLRFIPMVQAGWCRYSLRVDDEGNTFAVGPDPMYEGLVEELQSVKVGEPRNVHEVLQPVLSDAKILGVDLYEAGLGEYVESTLSELITGKGVVRAAPREYLAEAQTYLNQENMREHKNL